jgi:hypothetical protein
MRWRVLLGLLLGVMVLVLAPSAAAEAAQGESDSVVCPPQLQLRHPEYCPETGPGGKLAELTRQGQYPPRPLPITRPDPSLSYLPFTYRRISSDGVRLYGSVEDALNEHNAINSIEPGFVFVSWIECYVEKDKAIYMVAPGVYMRGGDSCSEQALPKFRGLTFSRTPSRPFGWVVGTTETVRSPGYNSPSTGITHYRPEVIQIYDQAEADGVTWYMIGVDEWIEDRLIAKVDPDARRPEGIPEDRWIDINLYEQTLSVYEYGQLVFATMVSTGLPGWWTQPGTFQVYAMLERDDMTGAFEADRSDYYLLEDVPWVLYFDKARAMHGAYWHDGYGLPRSHGCVNLSPPDAHWLYDWAVDGTWVHVWDPSGRTPTDPESYGDGGA